MNKKRIKIKNKQEKKKAKFELSAGGIVYNPKFKKILVIEYHDGRFGLPKGHNEKGETMVETAKRETTEETGVKNLKFIAKIGEIDYFFKLHGEFIFKKVVYFLFTTTNIKTKAQQSEIKKAQFISFEKAEKKLSFKNLLPLLKKSKKLL